MIVEKKKEESNFNFNGGLKVPYVDFSRDVIRSYANQLVEHLKLHKSSFPLDYQEIEIEVVDYISKKLKKK